MNITICCPGQPAQPWVNALSAALPQARVKAWEEGDAPADYAVVWAPPPAFLQSQTRLKALLAMGAGIDKLLQLPLPAGVPVVRLQDAGMAQQMVTYIVQGVLRHVRQFDVYAQQQQQGLWRPLPVTPADEAPTRVGVLGLGALGLPVARALQQLGFAVHGWRRSAGPELKGITQHSGPAGLATCLQHSQVLVNMLPLTPHTQDLLKRATLMQLPRGAYLINVARGAHVVDEDLLTLIDEGHLSGALLDVFRTEPLPSNHPFWTHPKITVTPHISARTLVGPSVQHMVRNILAIEGGQAPNGVVDATQGY
jgi:glyoxylate/hydroxypyruvate reductase A